VTVTLGTRTIGAGRPAFLIAEAGVNHNGDVDLAHRLVAVAAAAGADAVKFQTFDPALLVAAGAAAAPYQREATGTASQRALLEGLSLPPGAWRELRDHADDLGLVFLSTAFDLASADLLADLGVPAFKVPSGELTNLPLIAALAGYGRPLLISTGMGTLAEVDAALQAAAAAPARVLFHCVSAYPTPVADSNLRAIATMRARFGVPVGWSDHTQGALTATVAVALGASLIEKHVTLDRALPGPDHAASEDPDGLAAYVAAVRAAEAALGDGVKRPQPSEQPNRVHARRSLHAARDLPAGAVLTGDDVVALRPARGLSPATEVTGLRLARPVAAGAVLTADDVTGAG